MKPTTGRIVRYRGKIGLYAMRAAIVTADVTTLDPRGVEGGHVPALDSDEHVFWGDTGIAHWFIREPDLRARNFANVRYYWDCC